MLAKVTADDLAALTGAAAAGHLRMVVDRVVAFDDLPDAIRHVEINRARDKGVDRRPPQLTTDSSRSVDMHTR